MVNQEDDDGEEGGGGGEEREGGRRTSRLASLLFRGPTAPTSARTPPRFYLKSRPKTI